jgi:hypothetical protein
VQFGKNIAKVAFFAFLLTLGFSYIFLVRRPRIDLQDLDKTKQAELLQIGGTNFEGQPSERSMGPIDPTDSVIIRESHELSVLPFWRTKRREALDDYCERAAQFAELSRDRPLALRFRLARLALRKELKPPDDLLEATQRLWLPEDEDQNSRGYPVLANPADIVDAAWNLGASGSRGNDITVALSNGVVRVLRVEPTGQPRLEANGQDLPFGKILAIAPDRKSVAALTPSPTELPGTYGAWGASIVALSGTGVQSPSVWVGGSWNDAIYSEGSKAVLFSPSNGRSVDRKIDVEYRLVFADGRSCAVSPATFVVFDPGDDSGHTLAIIRKQGTELTVVVVDDKCQENVLDRNAPKLSAKRLGLNAITGVMYRDRDSLLAYDSSSSYSSDIRKLPRYGRGRLISVERAGPWPALIRLAPQPKVFQFPGEPRLFGPTGLLLCEDLQKNLFYWNLSNESLVSIVMEVPRNHNITYPAAALQQVRQTQQILSVVGDSARRLLKVKRLSVEPEGWIKTDYDDFDVSPKGKYILARLRNVVVVWPVEKEIRWAPEQAVSYSDPTLTDAYFVDENHLSLKTEKGCAIYGVSDWHTKDHGSIVSMPCGMVSGTDTGMLAVSDEKSIKFFGYTKNGLSPEPGDIAIPDEKGKTVGKQKSLFAIGPRGERIIVWSEGNTSSEAGISIWDISKPDRSLITRLPQRGTVIAAVVGPGDDHITILYPEKLQVWKTHKDSKQLIDELPCAPGNARLPLRSSTDEQSVLFYGNGWFNTLRLSKKDGDVIMASHFVSHLGEMRVARDAADDFIFYARPPMPTLLGRQFIRSGRVPRESAITINKDHLDWPTFLNKLTERTGVQLDWRNHLEYMIVSEIKPANTSENTILDDLGSGKKR